MLVTYTDDEGLARLKEETAQHVRRLTPIIDKVEQRFSVRTSGNESLFADWKKSAGFHRYMRKEDA